MSISESSALPEPPLQSSTFYLIRHGETDWNQTGRLQGNGNEARLTEDGKNQALAAGNRLKHELNGRDVQIWSSDLTRASETAELIASCLSFPVSDIRYDERLREADHGSLNGLLPEDYKSRPSYLSYKQLSPEDKFVTAMDPEKGESQRSVATRALALLQQITNSSPTIFVTHGGVIKSIQTTLTQNYSPINVNNGEGLIVQSYGSSPLILSSFQTAAVPQIDLVPDQLNLAGLYVSLSLAF